MAIAPDIVSKLSSGSTGTITGANGIWAWMLSDQFKYTLGGVVVQEFSTEGDRAKTKSLYDTHTVTVTAYHADPDSLLTLAAAVNTDLKDLEGNIGAAIIKKMHRTLEAQPFYDDVKNMWALPQEFIADRAA